METCKAVKFCRFFLFIEGRGMSETYEVSKNLKGFKPGTHSKVILNLIQNLSFT